VDDFRSIVKEAAKRKLIDLSKLFLDIVDELKKEDLAKLEKFSSVSKYWISEDDLKIVSPFLLLLDDCKKDILRKRILDKMNELCRELDN
jgi:hypothetical protein